MIFLDKNENQYGPSPECYDVVRNATIDMFNSYSRDYPKKIKDELSKEFNVGPENIMLGYGSEDILKQLLTYYVKPGDRVMVPDQSWWYYKSIIDDLKGEKILYLLDEAEDTFVWNVDRIIEMIKTHHPRLILICSPNNPTGNSITLDDIMKIMQHVNENNILVIDEAYWGFTSPLFKDENCISDYKNLAILRTFSKFYALAGIRIGFAFIGDNLKPAAVSNARYLGYNRISEMLSFAALGSKDYFLECSDKIRKDRDKIFDFFKSVGAKPFKSDANFMLIKLKPEQFKSLKAGLKGSDIVIKFFDEKVFENCIRITIGTEENTEQLLKECKAILK
jgi:histidinol-phosphate aminotransferase